MSERKRAAVTTDVERRNYATRVQCSQRELTKKTLSEVITKFDTDVGLQRELKPLLHEYGNKNVSIFLSFIANDDSRTVDLNKSARVGEPDSLHHFFVTMYPFYKIEN